MSHVTSQGIFTLKLLVLPLSETFRCWYTTANRDKFVAYIIEHTSKKYDRLLM